MQFCSPNIISLSLTFSCGIFLCSLQSADFTFWRFYGVFICLWLLMHVNMNLITNPCPSKELDVSSHYVTLPAVLHHYLAGNRALSLIHLLLWRLLEMPSGWVPVTIVFDLHPKDHRGTYVMLCLGWLPGACSLPISWLWCLHLQLPGIDATGLPCQMLGLGGYKSDNAAAVLKVNVIADVSA